MTVQSKDFIMPPKIDFALAPENYFTTYNPVLSTSKTKEIIFIDSAVEEYQSLVAGAKPGIEMIVLDSEPDGIRKIAEVLSGRTDISSLHIVSHGKPGSLQLGSTWLSLDNLAAYSDTLQQWKSALTLDADILLYGCNVASGEVGKAFVSQLSQLMEADVAASENLTGSAALGGDWEFEMTTGQIETDLAFSPAVIASYSFVLEAPVVSNNNITVDEGTVVTVTSAMLGVTDTDTADASLTYTLTSLPATGIVKLNGTAVATGGTFTQDDINNGRLTFTHDGSETTSDGFGFTVSDASTITRVSVATNGTQGNNSSYELSISADGRYVTFTSYASNLVSGDTNGETDIFLHDRTTGVTTRLSQSTGGTEGNTTSSNSAISADGRYVTFDSRASNLVSGDTNGETDIFLHDRTTGVTTRLSQSTGGTEGNSTSFNPAISADGRYVTFASYASNLVSGDTNGTPDIFIASTAPASSSTPVTGAATVTINPVNDAPILDASGTPTLTAIAEDTNSNTGTRVSTLLTTGAGGNPISDADTVAVEGIAVTGVDNTNGAWQYSLNNGTSWLKFTVSATSATLLRDTALVRFVPNANYNGTVTNGISFRAWDTTDGRANGTTGINPGVGGGSTAFSTATESASITVNPTLVKLTALDGTASESGGTGIYKIERVGGTSAPLTVQLALDGSSTASTGDYNLVASNGNTVTFNNGIATVTLATGQTSLNLTLTPVNDTLPELAETVTLNLGTGQYQGDAVNNQGTVTIDANDAISYAVATSTPSLTEGNTGSQALTFTVTRSGGVGVASTVNYALDGTATNGSDYNNVQVAGGGNAPNGTLNFGANETTKTITLSVLGDTVSEAAYEDIILTLSNPNLIEAPGSSTITTATATTIVRGDDFFRTINGTSLADKFTGTSQNERILGNRANDTIIGGFGDDLLEGGGENDVLIGDTSNVLAGSTFGMNDILLGGFGSDRMNGCGGNDLLYGEGDNDQLWGDGGNDQLWGGAGNDILTGGTGLDVFVLARGEGIDTIQDFQIGEDKIGLAGGITSSQLSITQQGSLTRITDTISGQTLANLTGVNAATLTANANSFMVM